MREGGFTCEWMIEVDHEGKSIGMTDKVNGNMRLEAGPFKDNPKAVALLSVSCDQGDYVNMLYLNKRQVRELAKALTLFREGKLLPTTE